MVEVGVEAVNDGGVAKTLVVAPLRHLRDGLAPDAVGLQAGLGGALVGLGGVRVAVAPGDVAVGRLADVPAFPHVGAQPAPGGFQGVEHLVLGHRLVDAALEDLLGPPSIELERLVPGEQRDPSSLQLALDGEVFEHPTRDT
ncbi:hypothetical protein [Streptomyces sp. B6B3]|uniref:hypothetical protein n=1 Tax=Streptomyces sp. B6B3 TaxID=3153570 RepID=UPI00325D753D